MTEEPTETKKPKVSQAEKRRRMASQVRFLSRKLSNTAPSKEEAALWESLQIAAEEQLKVLPLD
jgi:hypothetical protein